MFANTRLPSGWTQISSHSSFVSKLFLFPPWRNPMQFNHPKQFLNSLLTVPPHQNLLQPPYSISKAHFTTKSLSGPRSLGIPQTWRTQWEFSDRAWEFSFLQNGHLRWCLRKLLVTTTHEIVSFCCAVSWKKKGSWSVFFLSKTIYTIRTASVDTSGATTSQVIDALSRCSSVVTATKLSVLHICWKKKQGQ